MSIKSLLLLSLGFVTLALGIVGVFVPIMPTTPFVLVAAACFGVTSPKWHQFLLHNKYLGPYVENYQSKQGIAPTVKRNSLLFLWTSLLISAIIVNSAVVLAILILVGVAVSIHILMIKSR